MAIQERENDLVLGTFGRGFYVLDDYSPLRQLSQATFDRDGHVFPTKAAVIEVPETGTSRGSQGEKLWMAREPPARRDPHLLDQGRGAVRCGSAARTLASRGEIEEGDAALSDPGASSPRKRTKKRRRRS